MFNNARIIRSTLLTFVEPGGPSVLASGGAALPVTVQVAARSGSVLIGAQAGPISCDRTAADK